MSAGFIFFPCCTYTLWQTPVWGCFLHAQRLWLYFPIPGPELVVLFVAVTTCCRSYGDECCWAVVSIAEADVDIVLNSSDHLNTSGASQGTGGQRRYCPFPVFGVQSEKPLSDSWCEVEDLHGTSLSTPGSRWGRWGGRAPASCGRWASPPCSRDSGQLCGAGNGVAADWNKDQEKTITEAARNGSLGGYF